MQNNLTDSQVISKEALAAKKRAFRLSRLLKAEQNLLVQLNRELTVDYVHPSWTVHPLRLGDIRSHKSECAAWNSTGTIFALASVNATVKFVRVRPDRMFSVKSRHPIKRLRSEYGYVIEKPPSLVNINTSQVVRAMKWSSMDHYLAVLTDTKILVFEPVSHRLEFSHTRQDSGEANYIAWHPTDHTFLVPFDDNNIMLVLYLENTGISKVFSGHTSTVTSVAWMPDCKEIFISGSQDCTISFWLTTTRTIICTLNPFDESIYSLGWNRTTQYLFCAGRYKMVVYDRLRSFFADETVGKQNPVCKFDVSFEGPGISHANWWDGENTVLMFTKFDGSDVEGFRLDVNNNSMHDMFILTPYSLVFGDRPETQEENSVSLRFEEYIGTRAPSWQIAQWDPGATKLLLTRNKKLYVIEIKRRPPPPAKISRK